MTKTVPNRQFVCSYELGISFCDADVFAFLNLDEADMICCYWGGRGRLVHVFHMYKYVVWCGWPPHVLNVYFINWSWKGRLVCLCNSGVASAIAKSG